MNTASGISPTSAGASQSRGTATSRMSAATMLASATWASANRSRLGSPLVGTRQDSMCAVTKLNKDTNTYSIVLAIALWQQRTMNRGGDDDLAKQAVDRVAVC